MANNPDTLSGPDAGSTAWGLHGSLHRNCPHARRDACAFNPRNSISILKDDDFFRHQTLPHFYNRYVIDDNYGALEDEGERCAAMLQDPKKKVMIMGNHGVLVIGETVADTFNRLYYFERAAETYIRALQTGQPLRVLSDEVASKVADQLETYPEQDQRHFEEPAIPRRGQQL